MTVVVASSLQNAVGTNGDPKEYGIIGTTTISPYKVVAIQPAISPNPVDPTNPVNPSIPQTGDTNVLFGIVFAGIAGTTILTVFKKRK